MNIGISSSCFYPLETEKSLVNLGELGVKTAEVFLNSPSELKPEFIKQLCSIRDYYGINIVSFHPFMSFAEGYYIFSNYKRRFFDSLEMYKPMFESAACLGAKYFVLHGSKGINQISDYEYAERFAGFSKTAGQFGVIVAHENVVSYAGQTPEFMAQMKGLLGNTFKMVLDVKQARRAKQDPFSFIDAVGNSIVHLHLSDYSDYEDCLPPHKLGKFNFSALFDAVEKAGCRTDAVIEVYSHNYRDMAQLKDSMEYLQTICS